MFARGNTTTRWPYSLLGSNPAMVAQLTLFLSLGAMLALGCIIVLGRIHQNAGLLILVVMLAPALGVFATNAFLQAASEQKVLLGQLRWWHFLWLVIFLSGLMLRLLLRRTHWIQSLFQGLVGGLTSYSLYAALTTIWSVYPFWSLYKACEYGVDIAVLAAVLVTVRSVESYKSLFDWTWTLLGLALASAWLGAVVDPQDALDHYHF